VNVCRSTVCTSVGETLLQFSRGENRGLQDRAAAFIGNAQPANPLTVLQAHLLGSIHLPDFVRVLRALRILRGRTSPAWGRPQPGLLEPALQRAFGGQFLAAVRTTQKDQNQAGAPGRVFTAQFQRFVVKARPLLTVGFAADI
jgi:hypothetical protein